jgi:hypothetical protein
MRGALFGDAPAFIIILGGGTVAEELLNLRNIDAGRQKRSGGGSPEEMCTV